MIREFPDGFSRLLAMIAQWALGPEGLDRFRRQGRLCGHSGFRGTFLLDLGEGLAGGGVGCLYVDRGGEPPDDHVAISRIELDAVAAPSGLLGGDQRGAAAGEGVEHDATALRAVENRIGDQLDRLYGGVEREFRIAILAETIDARIRPDIGPIAAVFAELDIVDMRPRAGFMPKFNTSRALASTMGWARLPRVHPGGAGLLTCALGD